MDNQEEKDLDAHVRLQAGLMMADFFMPTPERGIFLHLQGKTAKQRKRQICAECDFANSIAQEAIQEYKDYLKRRPVN